MNRRIRRSVAAALMATAVLLAAACQGGDGKGDGRAVLRVLGGSELADLGPILAQAERDTGVRVQMDYAGTLDGVQRVLDGKVDGRYDAIWFSSNRYLSLHPGAQSRLGTATKTMSSPVVLGVRASVAARLGWDAKPPTWAGVARAVAEQGFTYGMTSPAASNSGFSALVAVAAALSGDGAALDAASIDRIAPRLEGFFAGQTLTAGSSGWLSDSYVRRVAQGASAGPPVDGLVNYESVLLSLNESGRLHERLTIVHPADGVVTADYPLTLLAGASDGARDGHHRLTDYLRRPDVQRRIMTQAHRRPVNPQVRPDGRFRTAPPELPFPARLDAVDALIGAYFDRIRRPARTVYVLDVSGSMAGQRLAALKAALAALTGADASLAGRFQRFHNREEVTLIPFSDAPREPRSFVVPEKDPAAELARVRSYTESLGVGGNTAVYTSVQRAYEILAQRRDDGRFTSIVLMSDGENNRGIALENLRSWLAAQPAEVRGVPVFPVLFGEAATGQMTELATLTGGRTFDARSQSLEAVFKEIRGYQ
ncbi:vWA domain-containing protein [Actinomadura sp. HBU206391]|uniref:vWA domain-containing protein n=1 Tax=Actinomadura sp. HBU206391 TaxID=2731692 RepID=UPI00164F9D68|nr:VWA domain-containing protein [Actinomadura sp. HBU206391]MBC6461045.1 VWA domain-containing protein [Actinomadura sp. HBU206391]